uniref:Uncharacterized protein n=1 Tax=Marseillevirus LCMAC102 TaxID=2506603 RepID=A0A481YTG5_9VIRU|nr:MAG: hypothetical protein LCMAC102_02670 [Marseillevirus LCMAC102]
MNIHFLDILAEALVILKNDGCQLFGFTHAGENLPIRSYCVRPLEILSPGGHYKAVSIKNIYNHTKGWFVLINFAQQLSMGYIPTPLYGGNLLFDEEKIKKPIKKIKKIINQTTDRDLLEKLMHKLWLELVSQSMQTIFDDYWESYCEPIAELSKSYSFEGLKRTLMRYLEYLPITLENVDFILRKPSLKFLCMNIVVQGNLPTGNLPSDLIEHLQSIYRGFR